jgi:hypothetical protein
MAIISKLAVGLFLAFVAARLGWPWPVLILPIYIALLAFTVPRKIPEQNAGRFPITRSLLLFLAAFLGLVMFAGWILGDALALFAAQKAEGTSLQVQNLLLGTPLVVTFWAITGGLVVAFLVSGAFLLAISYGLAPNNRAHRSAGEDVASMMGFVAGSTSPDSAYLVRNGALLSAQGTPVDLSKAVGVADILVQAGHALILERGGQVSRIVASGQTHMRLGERVSMIVPLFGRSEHVVLQNAASRDHVVIEEFECWVFHSLDPGPEERRVRDGQFAYNEEILLKRWDTGGSDWRAAVKNIAQNTARDIIGRFDLEQLVPISDSVRQNFCNLLLQTMNTVTSRLGIRVTAVDIGNIRVPEAVLACLQDRWQAEQARHTERIRVESLVATQGMRDQAREITIRKTIATLRDLLGEDPQPRDLIALRFIEYLETHGDGKNENNLDEIGTLLKLQSLETLDTLHEH